MSQPEEHLDSLTDGPAAITLEDGSTITMRPFALGSIGLFRKMGLSLFNKDEQDREAEQNAEVVADVQEPLSEAELSDKMMWETASFVWAQSTPVDELLGHIRNDTWTEEVERFSLIIPMHKMTELMAELNRISGLVDDVAVDVREDPKDSESEKDAPPNS